MPLDKLVTRVNWGGFVQTPKNNIILSCRAIRYVATYNNQIYEISII